jgi:hypothetical protein
MKNGQTFKEQNKTKSVDCHQQAHLQIKGATERPDSF